MNKNNCIVESNVVIGFVDVYQEELIVPEGIVRINEYAFSKYYGLERIVLPNSLKEIGMYAFHKCTSLRSIVIPSSVEHIGRLAFCGCENLLYADLQKASVTEISYGLFMGCKRLEGIFLHNNISRINEEVFNGCGNLKLFEVPPYIKIIESVPTLKYLECLHIPESLVHIEDLRYSSAPKTKIYISPFQLEKFNTLLPDNAKTIVSQKSSFDYIQEYNNYLFRIVEAYQKQMDDMVDKWRKLDENSKACNELVKKHMTMYAMIDIALGGHSGKEDWNNDLDDVIIDGSDLDSETSNSIQVIDKSNQNENVLPQSDDISETKSGDIRTIYDIKADAIELNRSTVYALDLPGSIADNLAWFGNIDSLMKLANTDVVDLLKIPGIGEKSIDKIKEKMLEYGIEMIDSRIEKEVRLSVKKVEFPTNLLQYIKEHRPQFRIPELVTDDITKGIRFAYTTLNDELQVVLFLRFEKHYTLKEVAEVFSLSSTQIENKVEKALQTWFKTGDIKYIEDGLMGHINQMVQTKAEGLAEAKLSVEYLRGYDEAIAELEGREPEPEKETSLLLTPIEELEFSVRTFNCLKRHGVETLTDILNLTFDELIKVRFLGRKSMKEISDKVKELGLVAAFEKEYGEFEKKD